MDNRQWSISNRQLMRGGGDYECLMDRQYQYVLANPSDHYGFLSHHTGECTDPVAEEGMKEFQIANCRLQIERLKV